MTTFTAILFAGATIVWLTYWMIVRPYLLESVNTDLYELRAELDWALIEGYHGSQSESASQLSKHLGETRLVLHASILPAIYFQMTRKNEMNAILEKHRELVGGSPDWLKNLWKQSSHLTLKATLTNSPFLWIPLAVVLLGAIFSYKIALWWKQTEVAAVTLSCQQT